MFGVGLHFSLKDLLSVQPIAMPGRHRRRSRSRPLLGWGLAALLGWPLGDGLVFGLALSVASTVVLLRALQERRLVETDRGPHRRRLADRRGPVHGAGPGAAAAAGRAAAGAAWQRRVRRPDFGDVGITLGITLGKVAAFVAVMLVVGRRVVPWILHYIAHTGSRELFRLAVLAIALGIAFGAAVLFGVSFALGAFFAGMVLSESELSHQAAQETLPLRDAFAVLFFVSVGMLFDPAILLEQFWPLLATLLIILFGKSIAAFLIVRAFGHPRRTALVISASLAQIGEFSFILAGLGVALGLLPQQAQDLILAGAILSILINPAVLRAAGPLARQRRSGSRDAGDARAPRNRAHDAERSLRPRRLWPRRLGDRRGPARRASRCW